jgi:hypothetical protein
MLSWFFNFIKRQRRQKAAHRAAWQDAVKPAFDLLSQFQYDAWSALKTESPDIVLHASGNTEQFLSGSIPGTDAVVFLYLDQAEVKGSNFLFSGEHYDYDTPSDLIQDLVAAAKQVYAI